MLLAKGAEHYGADNWSKGMPYRRTADSMIRHIYQWLAGDEEEDHLAAVCFGAMCLMTYESDKVLYRELDDRNENLKKILASILTSSTKDATLKTESKNKMPEYIMECTSGCGKSVHKSNKICTNCQTGDEVVNTKAAERHCRHCLEVVREPNSNLCTVCTRMESEEKGSRAGLRRNNAT